jgi:hypothetical protein
MSETNVVALADGAVVDTEEASPDGLVKLEGNTNMKEAGNFVLNRMKMGTEQAFKNVSSIWLSKTLTYEDGLSQIEVGRSKTEDIYATVSEMRPTVSKTGEFVFQYSDGRQFKPTLHAVGQIGGWAKTGTWYPESMFANPVDLKGRMLYTRDRGDAETIAHVFQNGLRRLDQTKVFLWRTRKDGTLRAMLTNRYGIVDNRWFIERLREFVPGGRLSHWRGDSDTIWGNVLIPDTIRADRDSDYGGMLSVGNSEIGERRVLSLPSIFRAICMNGCIHGRKIGKAIRQVHRGKIDLTALALEIKANLDAQIPLLPQGINKLLGSRNIGWDGAEAKVLFAQVAKDFKMGKKEAGAVLRAYGEEIRTAPETSKTLFAVINSITRAGQKLENKDWVHFDEIGGDLVDWDSDDFDHLIVKAKRLKAKEVDDSFALAA